MGEFTMARYQTAMRTARCSAMTFAWAMMISATFAQTTTYVPNDGDSGNWYEPERWDNGIPNAVGVAVVFNQPISNTANSVDLGGVPATGKTYNLSLMDNTTTIGSLTSNNASDPNKSFRTQINAGTLVFDSGSAAPAEINENLGASDLLESRLRINVPVVLNSDLKVSVNHALNRNTLTEIVGRVDGAADKTLIKEGLGNFQLAYTGGFEEGQGFLGHVQINAGGIRLIVPAGQPQDTTNTVFSKAAGITVADGAQLQFGNSTPQVSLAPGAELVLNGNGKPAFPGLVTQDGELRFDGAGRDPSGFEVICNFNNVVTLQTSSRINVAAAEGTGVLAQEVKGAGRLEKRGNGLLKLAGANTYAGGTLVSAGALAVNNLSGSGVGAGDVAVNGGVLGGTGSIFAAGSAASVTLTGGILAPGDLVATLGAEATPQLPNLFTLPGVLHVGGGVTFDAASTMQVDILAGTVTPEYDQLVAGGPVTLAGATLNLSLGQFTPTGAETFTIIDSASVVAGEFGNYAQGAPVDLAGTTFYINYHGGADGHDVVLAPNVPVLENADFNDDGNVDGADFLIWQRGLGAGGLSQGDANGDNQVNGADLAIWKAQFGTTGLSTGAAGAVPEPASLWLVGAAIGALGVRRSRRGRIS
jgi:autotransporter-associated beta strand protein